MKKLFVGFAMFFMLSVNCLAQAPAFMIKPGDTVGVLMYKSAVFKGTKKELIKLLGTSTTNQPNNDSAVIVFAWNKEAGSYSRGMYIKNKKVWERVAIIGTDVVYEVFILEKDDKRYVRFAGYSEMINGTLYLATDYYLQRLPGGWEVYEKPDDQKEIL